MSGRNFRAAESASKKTQFEPENALPPEHTHRSASTLTDNPKSQATQNITIVRPKYIYVLCIDCCIEPGARHVHGQSI